MDPVRCRVSLHSAALALTVIAFAAGPTLGSEGVATLGSPPPEEDQATGTNAVEDPMDGMLDYAACMRDHGIDMPDPKFGGGGFVMEFGGPLDAGSEGEIMPGSLEDVLGSEFISADEACSHHLGAMVSNHDPAQDAEIMDQLLAHTRCMRDHGIDMPDPVMTGGLISIGGASGPEGVADLGYDPFSEEYRSAELACRDVLPFADVGAGLTGIGE